LAIEISIIAIHQILLFPDDTLPEEQFWILFNLLASIKLVLVLSGHLFTSEFFRAFSESYSLHLL
jgi:hypothetical protein